MLDINKKIIVVDDISLHHYVIKERLKDYEFYPAKSAADLFGILQKIIPRLILLDINMPNTDGFETLEQLKADPLYENIPVIFLTAEDTKKNAVKALQLGAVDFIVKPYSDLDLIESIEYQLNPAKRSKNTPIILAVDDDPSILKSINHVLGDQYQVMVLPDPTKVKEVLKRFSPDLFLLDCNMPGLSGFDVVPIIREFPEHEHTPIIFLTSDGTQDNVYIAMHVGACDFVLKPIDKAILHEKLEQHLKHFKIKRRIRSIK
jgi:CheY-like chemotaxis protein